MPATECPHCGKRIKFPDKLLGKRAKCPFCKEPFTLSVEEEIPELVPKKAPEEEIPELAPRGRPSKPKKAAKKFPLLPVLIGGLLIIAVVMGAVVLSPGNGKKKEPSGEKNALAAKGVSEEEWREDEASRQRKVLDEAFYRKSAEAETADALYELSLWCKEKGLEEYRESTLKKALIKDPDHEKVREALGFVRNEHKTSLYIDKDWLSSEEAKRVAEEVARLAREEEERQAARAADPYLCNVDKRIADVESHPFFKDVKFSIAEEYRPYLIFIEEADERGWHKRQLGDLLAPFYKSFQESYKERFSLPEIEMPLVIISLKTTERYYEYGKMRTGEKPTSLAHYELGTKQIIVHGTGSESYPYNPIILGGIITHEATHQLVDYFTIEKTGNPFPLCLQHWFQEGFAEFQGCLIWDKKSRITKEREYKFNQYHDARMREYESAYRNGEYFTFDEMISITTKEDLHRKAMSKNPKTHLGLRSLFYAQAWSFIWFCHHYEKGKYKDKFLKVMEEELSGHTGPEVFYAIFGRENVPKIESEWWEYLKKFWVLPEEKEKGKEGEE